MLRVYKNMWKNGFNFKNRTSRRDYWITMFSNLLIYIILYFLIFIIIFIVYTNERIPINLGTIYAYKYNDFLNLLINNFNLLIRLYALISIIPLLALHTRRLHDINRSGKTLITILLISFGSLIIFILWSSFYYLLSSNNENYSVTSVLNVSLIIIFLIIFIVPIIYLIIQKRKKTVIPNKYGNNQV